MSLNNVCLTITEDAGGANGPERLDRHARIESAAEALGDWAYESLLEDGVDLGPAAFHAVLRLVARAMITQHDFDQELARPAAVPW